MNDRELDTFKKNFRNYYLPIGIFVIAIFVCLGVGIFIRIYGAR